MNRHQTRPLLWAAALVFLTAAYITFTVGGKSLENPRAWLEAGSTGVTVCATAWLLFSKYAWKWGCWQGWLVKFPCIQGTWRGFLKSNWVNPETGQGIPEIPIQITIHQTYYSLRFVQRTGESESKSFCESIVLDEHDPTAIEFVFCYRNVPHEKNAIKVRSAPHEGACILKYSGFTGKRLSGYYWTNRRPLPTTGSIEVSFYSTELLDTMAKDVPPHPLS